MNAPPIRIATVHLAWLITVSLGLMLSTWAVSSGDLWSYTAVSVPDGQLLYVLSKACGLTAVVLVWIQLLVGLLVASRATVPRIPTALHQQLGVTVLFMLVLHWTTFVGAVSLRTHKLGVDYIFPSVSHGFYRMIVSLGIVSLLTILVASVAPLMRAKFARWRLLHFFASLGAIGGAVHSWLIGSETRMAPVRSLYLFMILTLVGALIWRVLWGWSRRSGRAGSFA